MSKLPDTLYKKVLAALRHHRNARAAARAVGINPVTAWRIANKHKIDLISLSAHMRKRRRDPKFNARQAAAASHAATKRLTHLHKTDPDFHGKTVKAARANLTELNRDPEFRAASAERLRTRYADPEFRAKQAKAASQGMKRHHRKRKHPLNEF
jgi:hypothetical protein